MNSKFIVSLFLVLVTVLSSGWLHAQWMSTSGPREGGTSSLVAQVTTTGDTVMYVGAAGGSVFRSGSLGESWMEIDGGTWWMSGQDTGFTSSSVTALAHIPNVTSSGTLFAGTYEAGVFTSPNADTNWAEVNSGLTNRRVFALLPHSRDSNAIDLIAGTAGGVFISTNSGATWQMRNTGLANTTVLSLAGVDTMLYAGTNWGIFRSSDNGAHWNLVLASYSVNALLVSTMGTDQPLLYAGGDFDSIYVSEDRGSTWSALAPLNPFTRLQVTCLAAHDTILYAGTYQRGMYYSRDRGSSWVEGNQGIGRRPVNDLLVCGDYLYAASMSDVGNINSVWRRRLSDMLTGVTEQTGAQPDQFSLHQNYPNPFNPSTTIGYTLPHRSHVSLVVFNTLGQQVANLVNREMEAGYHAIRFDASTLSSGVYFYCLKAGDDIQTEKLILLR